jgi:hypothetical protein
LSNLISNAKFMPRRHPRAKRYFPDGSIAM